VARHTLSKLLSGSGRTRRQGSGPRCTSKGQRLKTAITGKSIGSNHMTEIPARETLRIYGASDYAVTTDGGDFTVHGVFGVDPEGGCICWTFGASRHLRWIGLNRSVTWYCSGSPSNGPKNRARSNQASVRSLIAAARAPAYCVRESFRPRRRQGDQGTIGTGIHRATRAVRQNQCSLVSGLSFRTSQLSAGKHDDQVDARACSDSCSIRS
jgi:hypothetical protein